MGLRDSLQLLRVTSNSFDNKMDLHKVNFENPSFSRLIELIEKMNSVRSARKVFCPEEYISYWTRYQKQEISEIPPRVRRFLCWEPSIGADNNFLEYLKKLKQPLSANYLQGLVYSRHSSWLSCVSQTNELAILRHFILQYKGRNRLINKWSNNVDLILKVNSPNKVAEIIVESVQPVSEFCENWGLNEQTAFFSQAVFNTALLCLKYINNFEVADQMTEYFINEILEWNNLELEVYKSLISQTILKSNFINDENFQEKIVGHIISDERLGDPRLPVNSQNWVGIENKAHTRILQVLSRADIVFFFDQVMTGHDDRHGRKDFWLQYISSLKQSRPLLNRSDRVRLKYILRQQGKKMLHFGQTRGQYSAFLLDFGEILVVEFNGVGACYIYDEIGKKRFFYDMYTDEVFTDDKLKQKYYAVERISHRGDWQWRLSYELAQYGIRPS